MAGVPSRSKMYRTSAISDVHFVKDIYILLPHLQKMYIVLNFRLSLDDNRL